MSVLEKKDHWCRAAAVSILVRNTEYSGYTRLLAFYKHSFQLTDVIPTLALMLHTQTVCLIVS